MKCQCPARRPRSKTAPSCKTRPGRWGRSRGCGSSPARPIPPKCQRRWIAGPIAPAPARRARRKTPQSRAPGARSAPRAARLSGRRRVFPRVQFTLADLLEGRLARPLTCWLSQSVPAIHCRAARWNPALPWQTSCHPRLAPVLRPQWCGFARNCPAGCRATCRWFCGSSG